MSDFSITKLNDLILQDLLNTVPEQEILNHIHREYGFHIFVLESNSHLFLSAADENIQRFFPYSYKSGEGIFCFRYDNDLFVRSILRPLRKQKLCVIAPQGEDSMYSVCRKIPGGAAGSSSFYLFIKFEDPELLDAAKAISGQLSLLIEQVSGSDVPLSAVTRELSSADALARELLLYDNDAPGAPHSDLSQSFFMRSEALQPFTPPYVIAAARPKDPSASVNFQEIVRGTRRFWPEQHSILFQNKVLFFIYNYSPEDPELLAGFSRKNGLLLGLSDTFSELGERRFYKRQALHLLQYGPLLAPDRCIFPYLDFYNILICVNAMERVGIPPLILTDIRTLAEYDRANNTSFLETLECFLENSAAYSLTAKQLFIDRSTLSYRLNHISKIIHSDFMDTTAAPSLYTSIKFWRFLEQNRKNMREKS